MDVEAASNLPLPDAFLDFLSENGLDSSIYTASDSTPRYIRLKPGCEAYLEEIEAEIKCEIEKVAWLPDFYSLPPHIQIAKSKAYQEGKKYGLNFDCPKLMDDKAYYIYGIDAASGAAVLALNISSGDHILDLCAAPGAKLCMVLDLLGCSGSVTGVDVTRHRLAACRTILQKYALGDHCRLFVADGTTFSLLPVRVHSDSKTCESALEEKVDAYKEWTSKRSYKERKRVAKARETAATQLVSRIQDPELIFYGRHSGVVGLNKSDLYQTVHSNEALHCGYDKKPAISLIDTSCDFQKGAAGFKPQLGCQVLVDAECTHDGSIKHIQKFEHWGWKTLQRRVLNAERTDELTVLQLQLLTNGFRLLKVGGSLVYSTCSLTIAQNEDVVEQFLLQNASAELLEIDAAKNWPCKSGQIPKTLRFDPLTSRTSGLFVAKFTKLAI